MVLSNKIPFDLQEMFLKQNVFSWLTRNVFESEYFCLAYKEWFWSKMILLRLQANLLKPEVSSFTSNDSMLFNDNILRFSNGIQILINDKNVTVQLNESLTTCLKQCFLIKTALQKMYR